MTMIPHHVAERLQARLQALLAAVCPVEPSEHPQAITHTVSVAGTSQLDAETLFHRYPSLAQALQRAQDLKPPHMAGHTRRC